MVDNEESFSVYSECAHSAMGSRRKLGFKRNLAWVVDSLHKPPKTSMNKSCAKRFYGSRQRRNTKPPLSMAARMDNESLHFAQSLDFRTGQRARGMKRRILRPDSPASCVSCSYKNAIWSVIGIIHQLWGGSSNEKLLAAGELLRIATRSQSFWICLLSYLTIICCYVYNTCF